MYKTYFFYFLLFFQIFFSQEKKESFLGANFYYQLVYTSPKTQNVYQEPFLLHTGKEKTVFTSNQQIKNDSITDTVFKKMENGSKLSDFRGQKRTIFTSYIIKNKVENTIFVVDNIAANNFIYKEEKANNQWKIENETKEISGYKCQKASVSAFGREFIAWFTTEIPIQDGPYKFWGLPGLIIDLYDKENIFHFSLIKYNSKEDSNFIFPKFKFSKLKEVDKKTYIEAKLNYKTNLVDRARMNGIEIDENKAKEIRNRANNEIKIELE
jgi:GLPGLI family protein